MFKYDSEPATVLDLSQMLTLTQLIHQWVKSKMCILHNTYFLWTNRHVAISSLFFSNKRSKGKLLTHL